MSEEEDQSGRGSEDRIKASRGARNAPEVDAKRLMSGEAWDEFCDRLKAAGRHILDDEAPDTPLDRAEGFRYLTGLVGAGIESMVKFADPDRPVFYRTPDSAGKWGAENADNQYLWARIRPDATYRVTGVRTNVFDFLLEVKEGFMQLGDARNFATFTAQELEVESDGTFEIILSAEKHAGNWVPLDPDARYFAIRQYFYDWENEIPIPFEIERVGGEGEAPPLLEPADMARRLDDAGEWIDVTIRVWNEWVAELRANQQRNVIAPPRKFVGGADDIRYGNDAYKLADDEALILESDLPDARYWAFQLVDLWFGSMDYTNRQVSLNGHQARVDADGKVRVVVAHRDPGVPNWLDTAGHLEGILQYRWIWTKTYPVPTARVVKFDQIRAELPADTPSVTEAERKKVIHGRQRHVAKREPVT